MLSQVAASRIATAAGLAFVFALCVVTAAAAGEQRPDAPALPKIKSIRVVGSQPVPARTIRALMKTKAGQSLDQAKLQQDIEAIQTYYQDEGYIAYVTENAGLNAKTGMLTIPIRVHKVESVEITGLTQNKPEVFLSQMGTKPGVIFNVKTLREDIIRIYNSGLVGDVRPYAVAAGSKPGLLKITVPVVEKKAD